MRTMIFGAASDLGVHIDGANLGPLQLLNDLEAFYTGETGKSASFHYGNLYRQRHEGQEAQHLRRIFRRGII